MAQTIVVPGGDRLEFPDGMSDADIEKAIFAEYPDLAPKPGVFDRIKSALTPSADRAPMPSTSETINAPSSEFDTGATAATEGAISMPGSVMDGYVPRESDQGVSADSGMGPMRQSYYDETRAGLLSAPIQSHAAAAQAGGQVGKVARDTLPQRLDKAGRELSGDILPKNRQELTDDIQAGRYREDEIGSMSDPDAGLSEFGKAVKFGFSAAGDSANPLIRGAGQGVAGFGQWAAGLGEIIGDMTGNGDLVISAQDMRRRWKSFENEATGQGQFRKMADVTQAKDSGAKWLEEGVQNAANSITRQLPGLLTGSTGPALTMMFMDSLGTEYGIAKAAGRPADEALSRAALFAGFEVAGEKLALDYMMPRLRDMARGVSTEKLPQFFAGLISREVPGELFTHGGQSAVDATKALGLRPDMTLEQYFAEIPAVVRDTIIQSGLMAGSGSAMNAGIRAVRSSTDDLTAGRDFIQASIDAAARQSLDPANAQLFRSGGLLSTPIVPRATPADVAAAETPEAAAAAIADIGAGIAGSVPITEALAATQAEIDALLSEPIESAALPQTPIPVPPMAQPGAVAADLRQPQVDSLSTSPTPIVNASPPSGAKSLGFVEAFASLQGGGITEKLYAQAFDALQNGKTTIAGIRDPLLQRAKAAFDAGLIKSPADIRGFEQGGYPSIPNPSPAPIVTQQSDNSVPPGLAQMRARVAERQSGADGVRKGEIGGMMESGEVVLTSSGRQTTAFPKIKSGPRGTATTLKAVDAWLMQNALDEARSRGDEFNARQFEQNLAKPSQADKDSAEEYLFGQQPNVPALFLKPLVPGSVDSIDTPPQRVENPAKTEQVAAPDVKVRETPSGVPKSITRTKGGKLEITGFDRDEVADTLKTAKITATVTAGKDGRVLVSATDRAGNATKISIKQQNAISKALMGASATPKKARKLSGNLKNDLDIIAPGLYGEVARGGDGEANDAAWGDVSLIAEKMRDEQGYMLPHDANGQDLANSLRELIRQHAGGDVVLNEARQAAAMTEEETKRHRSDVLRLADEYGIPAKEKGIWRKSEDVLADVEKAIKHELGISGRAVVEITKSGVAAGAFTNAEAKSLALEVAEGYRDDQGRDAKVRMYREIANLLQDKINERESAESREVGRGSGESRGTPGEVEAERPAIELAGQSEAEARADEERIAAAEAQAREEETRAAAAERQARIDAEVASRQDVAADNFTLDAQVNDRGAQKKADKKRIDDQLAGQNDIFSAAPPNPPVEVFKTGEAVVVDGYHGTNKSFERFDISKAGIGYYGKGFYFSSTPADANTFAMGTGANVIRAKLSISNPLVISNKDKLTPERRAKYGITAFDGGREMSDQIMRAGFDGVIIEHAPGRTEFVVFSPEQINQGAPTPEPKTIAEASLGDLLRAAADKADDVAKPKDAYEAAIALSDGNATREATSFMRDERNANARAERASAWRSKHFAIHGEAIAAGDISRSDYEKLGDLVDRGGITAERAMQMIDDAVANDIIDARVGNDMKKKVASEGGKPVATKEVEAKLKSIAERMGIQVIDAGQGFHAGGNEIYIPDADVDSQGVVSRVKVFAHELGHAAMQKRGISYKGFPVAELRKQVANWDDLVLASKAYRPEVHNHENDRFRRHAMKPNEIIADAIASVLTGTSDFSLLKNIPIMRHEIGLDAKDEGKETPASLPSEAAKERESTNSLLISDEISTPATDKDSLGVESKETDKGVALESRSKPQEETLIIQHNLSAENLLHAVRMGGIPVPSLAVTNKNNPLTGFGEITLLGSKEMADPKGYAGTKVFGADIYSPRYPSVTYKLDSKAVKKLNAALASFRREGGREIYSGEISKIEDLTQIDAFRAYMLDKTGKTDIWDLRSEDMEAEASRMLAKAGAEEKLFKGYDYNGNRRYQPHTLENVVKTLKKELRGGENFNYGVGSIRAKFTPQFRSIEQIRKAKGRLMDKAGFEKVKSEIDAEFSGLQEALTPYHSHGMEFGFGDVMTQMMYDAAGMGISRSLRENQFKEVPAEQQQEIAEFLTKLRDLPTEYFEAKILRDVDLAEFSGAVVPEGVNPKVIEALNERGIMDIRYYKKGEDGDRARVVEALADELHAAGNGVLFSKQSVAYNNGYGLPARNLDGTLDATTLRDLRREAAGLESPERGTYLRVTADGRAIATGEKGTRVPETFTRFAEKHGLTFDARRIGPGNGTAGSDITRKSQPMPVEYRESGAMYFGESGAFIDRTGKTRFSKSPAATITNETPATIRAGLHRSLGKATVDRLEQNGLLRILDTADSLPNGLTISSTGTALYDGKTAYIIADRTKPAEAIRAALHEIGEHHGLEGMLGEKGYKALSNRVRFMEKAGNKRVKQAFAEVRAAYIKIDPRTGKPILDSKGNTIQEYAEDSREFMKEILANIGQDADVRARPWWKEMIAAVRRWLVQLGYGGLIRTSDIEDMVLHSLKMASLETGSRETRAQRPAMESEDSVMEAKASAEMVAKRMFHATSTESAALKILEDGEIRPPDNKHARGKLAPVVGRTYVSPSLENASIYSLGGVMMGHDYNWSARTDRAAGQYGYIFEIDPSSYGDVQPDEDSVGELAADAMKDVNRNSELRWLADLAETLGTPNQIRDAKFGEYAAWAQLGKKLVKHMTDAQKTLLIDRHGAHIANQGPLKIARAWKVDKSKAKEIAKDGSNVLDVAEQVYGDKYQAEKVGAGKTAFKEGHIKILRSYGAKISGDTITLYRGGDVPKSVLKQLRYGDYLSANESGSDATGNAAAGAYGKNVVRFDLPVGDIIVTGAGEYQYKGGSKSLSGGSKYPVAIYKAYNDAYGSNYTASEIDEQDNVRSVASQALRDGRDEFDALMRKHEKGAITESRTHAFKAVDTKSAAFKAWFGDSKVVDADGKPLVVYHGTDEDITEFDPKKQRPGRWGKGFYFASSPERAKQYGKNVIPVYLRIERSGARDIDADGMIIGSKPSDRIYVVQDPAQIKSAEKNTGAFSRDNPSILESRNRGLLNRDRDEDLDPDTSEAAAVQAGIEGRSPRDAAQFIIDTGSEFQREVAQKVLIQLNRLALAGVKLELKVAHNEQKVPGQLTLARGLTDWSFAKDGNRITVWINGADVVGKVGTSYTTLLHELIHMATAGVIHLGGLKAASTYKTGKDVADLIAVTDHVRDHFNQRVADAEAGNAELTDFEQRIKKRANNALDSADEVLAWALSNPDAQAYMEAIPYPAHESAWSAFVSAIRRILGIPEQHASAFTELLRVADNLMSDNVNEILGIDTSRGFNTIIQMPRGSGQLAAINSRQQALPNTGATPPAPPTRQTPIGLQGGATGNNASWNGYQASKLDDVIRTLQDKYIDSKRTVQAIKAAGRQVADKWNVYEQETKFHGRAAKRTLEFVETELTPLARDLAMRGLTLAELEEYLHARHAPEANALIAQRNPAIPDGGSGMTNQQAAGYFANLDPSKRRRLAASAARVDAIIAGTRQAYVSYGLESQDTINGWAATFQHYVPLMREDKDGAMGIGQGFSIKGKESKSRTGSTRAVVDILANIAMQRERAITRGEKNRVSVSLLGLAKLNPNPDFWTVDRVPMIVGLNPATGMVESHPDPNYKNRENVVVAKVPDGKGGVQERAVIFNEDSEPAMNMALALKNLDVAHLEGFMGAAATVTRYFASINTQYNPVFGVANLFRDTQEAMLNLGSTPIAGRQADVLKHTLGALRGIYIDTRQMRKGQPALSSYAQLWEEFQHEGGQTGYREMFRTSADRAKAIERAINPYRWMDSTLGQIFTAAGTLKVPVKVAQNGATWLFDWLSDYNEAMENAVRLSAYKVGIDNGMSKHQAIVMAKGLTVNFNRKGQIAQQAGALYAFFNAAVQGTGRLTQTLFTMQGNDIKTARLSRLGVKIVAGGILWGSLQALMLMAAGFGDDDPPEFVREKNTIIPWKIATLGLVDTKQYTTIPMPLGFAIFPNIGRLATEFVMGGFKNPGKYMVKILGIMADAFNPVGGNGTVLQVITPTALDPLAALAENKDWTKKPIAKASYDKTKPGFTQWKDTASTPSKMIAEAINSLSGGTKYVAGSLSPTPDQIDYLFGQVTGGVGRELGKLEQSVVAAATGDELPPHKIPLVGRFYGNSDASSSQGTTFYNTIQRMNEHEATIKGLRKDGKGAEAAQYIADNPEARLVMRANHVERQVQKMRKEKHDLIEKGATRERVKAVEERIKIDMRRFNEAIEALKKRQKEAA